MFFQKRAGIAQLVERNLAKVDVAGSNPVSRSNLSRSIPDTLGYSLFWVYRSCDQVWPSHIVHRPGGFVRLLRRTPGVFFQEPLCKAGIESHIRKISFPVRVGFHKAIEQRANQYFRER